MRATREKLLVYKDVLADKIMKSNTDKCVLESKRHLLDTLNAARCAHSSIDSFADVTSAAAINAIDAEIARVESGIKANSELDKLLANC